MKKRFFCTLCLFVLLIPFKVYAKEHRTIKVACIGKPQHFEYVNPTKWFTDVDGTMKPGLYGGDYIHLTQEGYKVWGNEIIKLIK